LDIVEVVGFLADDACCASCSYMTVPESWIAPAQILDLPIKVRQSGTTARSSR
jgi:hypothetical protein